MTAGKEQSAAEPPVEEPSLRSVNVHNSTWLNPLVTNLYIFQAESHSDPPISNVSSKFCWFLSPTYRSHHLVAIARECNIAVTIGLVLLSVFHHNSDAPGT